MLRWSVSKHKAHLADYEQSLGPIKARFHNFSLFCHLYKVPSWRDEANPVSLVLIRMVVSFSIFKLLFLNYPLTIDPSTI